MNIFTAITNYMPQVVDKIFCESSKTAIFKKSLDGKINLDFNKVGYVEILSVLVDGLADYHRANEVAPEADYSFYQNGGATGYRTGSSRTKWEMFKLRFDRGRQFAIDNVSNDELAKQAVAVTLSEFLRTKVIPEADAVRFSAIASATREFIGNRVTETIADNKIIEAFNKAFRYLTDKQVPSDRQVLCINANAEYLLDSTDELRRVITQTELKLDNGAITLKVKSYNGRPIIVVPADRFYTDIVVSPSNSYHPSATSKLINFIACSLDAVLPVVKVEKTKVYGPEEVQSHDGYLINFRMFHDCFIPTNKKFGVYASISNESASGKVASVMVDTVAGSATNSYKVAEYVTDPQGLMGRLFSRATEYTYGETVVADANNKLIEVGADNVVGASVTQLAFAVVDGSNRVIAISDGLIDLHKKA